MKYPSVPRAAEEKSGAFATTLSTPSIFSRALGDKCQSPLPVQ